LFGAHDRRTGYDITIISCFNPLFGATIGNDNLNIFLILSYLSFVIFILSFLWVSNLIAYNYQALIPPSIPTASTFLYFIFYFLPNRASRLLLLSSFFFPTWSWSSSFSMPPIFFYRASPPISLFSSISMVLNFHLFI